MSEKKLRILFIPRDKAGCGFYRMLVPANEIKKQDLADVKVSYEWDWELVEWSDIIVIQRQSEMPCFEAIEQAQAVGKKIVYEIDDLIQDVSPWNQAFKYWTPMGPNLGRALRLIERCNAVQVSTERLRNEFALWNPSIDVLPNYLDKTLWDEPQWKEEHLQNYTNRKNDNIIRIGWVGAVSHYHDLQLVEQIITKICNKYHNVHFCMMGYFGESKIGTDLFQGLIPTTTKCPHCNKGGQLEKIQGIDLLYYPSRLRECAFDIGIAPLIETGFNEAKSDLKIKEYSALGIPVVASNITPYKSSIIDGETGFLASTGKEWFESLEKLIKDKRLRNRMGKNMHLWYKENTIDKHINKWIEFYQRVVNTKYKW